MKNKYIYISEVSRITSDGEVEKINFSQGVNLISGAPNSGKTTWLRIVDYVLGKNKSVKDVFSDQDLVTKYVQYELLLEVSGKIVRLGRMPFEPNMSGKITINGHVYDVEEFSEEIFRLIGYPYHIKFPKGNQYTTEWVKLSFRIVFRHIYRRESYWSDIADKQPINDQFAAIFYMLGLADKIFSKRREANIRREKELLGLEAERNQYLNILNRIVYEMSPKYEVETGEVTNEYNLGIKIQELEDILSVNEQKRQALLSERQLRASTKENAEKQSYLLSEISRLQGLLETESKQFSDLRKRHSHFENLVKSIGDEISKLKRAQRSGSISDLTVTHCPACDQSLANIRTPNIGHCYLCDQKTDIVERDSTDRIEFEIKQLESQLKEVKQVHSKLTTEILQVDRSYKEHTEALFNVESELKPLKGALAFLSGSEISEIDVARGRITEQIQNLKRLQHNFHHKAQLDQKIKDLELEILRMRTLHEQETISIDFQQIANDLELRMQFYVDSIAKTSDEIWSHKGQISIAINDERVSFYVNNKSWNTLGALDRDIFLLSYHYGLLAMSELDYSLYPGLVIIDLPADLGKAESSSYNYLIKPFVQLCKRKRSSPLQVIIAGRGFDDIENVNKIRLDETTRSPL